MSRKTRNILLITLCICGGIFIFGNDPSRSIYAPKCPLKLLTGWDCPACGTQRFIYALFDGDICRAFSYNYFYLLGVPYLLALALNEIQPNRERRKRIRHYLEGKPVAYTYLVIYVVWWVVRNL